MKLYDLEVIFEEAWDAAFEAEFAAGGFQESAETYRRFDRAGLQAVVKVLYPTAFEEGFRNSGEGFNAEYPYDDCKRMDQAMVDLKWAVDREIDNILADDQVEKVAGVTVLEAVDAGLSPASGQAPATDQSTAFEPAIFFCECRIEMASFRDPGTYCLHCSRPIRGAA